MKKPSHLCKWTSAAPWPQPLPHLSPKSPWSNETPPGHHRDTRGTRKISMFRRLSEAISETASKEMLIEEELRRSGLDKDCFWNFWRCGCGGCVIIAGCRKTGPSCTSSSSRLVWTPGTMVWHNDGQCLKFHQVSLHGNASLIAHEPSPQCRLSMQ